MCSSENKFRYYFRLAKLNARCIFINVNVKQIKLMFHISTGRVLTHRKILLGEYEKQYCVSCTRCLFEWFDDQSEQKQNLMDAQ